MPARFGGAPVLVSPDSALSYWLWDLEKANCGHALESAKRFVRVGDVVFDIGANLGLFAFAAASMAGTTGRVIALEPDPFFVHLICRSSRLQTNPRAPVHVFQAAAAAEPGVAQFVVARHGRSSSFLKEHAGRSSAGGRRTEFPVLTTTVDWLAERLGPPTLLKIDVEGSEAAVLRGAAETLREHHPRMILEVGPETASEVGTILQENDYHLQDAQQKRLDSIRDCTGDLYAE
jgi:FkbM family methyltransferase